MTPAISRLASVRRFSKGLVCLLLLLSSGCGAKSLSLTAASEYAVLNVVNQYLVHIANGRAPQATSMILWGAYIQNEGKQIPKNRIAREIRVFGKRWNKKQGNPLLNFDVVNVHTEGSRAVVDLRKSDAPNQEPITISVEWVGAGWLIVDDSLFGTTGFVTTRVS